MDIKPTDHLITPSSFNISPKSFSIEKVKHDLDVLIYFFIKGYSGYDHIERSKVRLAIEKMELCKKKQITSWYDLCCIISLVFKNLPDAHLDCQYHKYCEAKSSDDCENKSQIGKNIADKHSQIYKVNYGFVGTKTYAVLGISKFLAPDNMRWEGFYEVVDNIKNQDFIIIDLRGNSGGSDVQGIELARRLSGKKILRSSYSNTQYKETLESYILLLNKITLKRKNDDSKFWRKLQEQYFNLLKNKEKKLTFNYDDGLSKEGIRRTSSFKRPILVLVDGECGSAGENAMQALKVLKNTKVVGQNTKGVTHFGNQGLLILPHSRIRISLSTNFTTFNDGTFVEKVGHKPDIYVPCGEDAVEFVLREGFLEKHFVI